ncbi:MAG: DUF6171 family protein [Planctomycetaceae bacterium]
MIPKLTIGMATAGDFDGPVFTLQALRLYHRDVIDQCELLLIDNTPETRIGERLKRFCAKTGVRYVSFPEPQGTAAPRQHIFEQAASEQVLCLDSHILLPPGVVGRLIDWFEAHPESRDLVTGPIVWDDLTAAHGKDARIATHFEPAWGAGMWGRWATDERGLDPEGKAFEIGMMGLGLFACRKDAFPGFNSRMVGFGGEEGYLHEKVRRAGGKNLCLPWLRWWHRFNEFVPGAAPYVATVEDKAWNYCVGWGELGWDLAPVREHFATLMPVEKFDAIAKTAERGDALPPHRATPSLAVTNTDDCGCQGKAAAVPSETLSDNFAVHSERLRPFIERIGDAGVVYEHSLAGSPATATLAELHAGKTISFSPRHDRDAFEAFNRHGKERLRLLSGAATEPKYEADLIVLSGYPDGAALREQLSTAAEKARRLLVVLGTDQADSPQRPGRLTGVRLFLRKQPEWSVVAHAQEDGGLTVLSRDDRDKPQLPSKITMAANFTQAVAKHVADGATKVDAATLERRLAICTLCEHRRENRCTVCGCYLAEKAAWRTSECPLGKWPTSETAATD